MTLLSDFVPYKKSKKNHHKNNQLFGMSSKGKAIDQYPQIGILYTSSHSEAQIVGHAYKIILILHLLILLLLLLLHYFHRPKTEKNPRKNPSSLIRLLCPILSGNHIFSQRLLKGQERNEMLLFPIETFFFVFF